MRSGITYVSLLAVATAVLAGTAACGSSSKPPLTTDQVSTQLLTSKDVPEWNFDPSSDERSTPYGTDTATSDSSACQAFVNATDLSSAKYGTTDNILRTFTTTPGSQNLLDDVALMPSKAKAAALMSDLTSGLNGCVSLVDTNGGSPTTLRADVGAPAGHVLFTMTTPSGAHTLVVITDMVQVGEEVVTISYLGGEADNSAKVQQLVTHAAEAQAARLKAAQG